VLGGMLIGLGCSVRRITQPHSRRGIVRLVTANPGSGVRARSWWVPALCVAGLAVASYLAHVELTHVEAICGPVGECNVVQTSDYALLLGIPVAVWGVAYYIAVAALWAGNQYLGGRLADLALLGLLGLTHFGTLFSIYLTCLELFAIHAICSWCLSSAVISTALMILVVFRVTSAWPNPLHPARAGS